MKLPNPSISGLHAHALVARILDAAATAAPELPSLVREWSRRIAGRTLSEADFLCVLYALKVRQGLQFDPQVVAAIARGLRRDITVPSPLGLHDNSGTGGGTQKTVNISSAAALVASACGVPIVKHGFKGVTSGCGSRDGLSAAGICCANTPEMAMDEVLSVGISYVDFHISVPWEFRYPTYSPLNEAGPLSHPLPLQSRVIGTADQKYFDLIRECLVDLEIPRVILLYNVRIDEIDLWTPTRICDLTFSDGVHSNMLTFDPSEFPIVAPKGTADAISSSGSPRDNWLRIASVLSGETGEASDLCKIISANAGISLWAHGVEASIETGIDHAMSVLKTGGAMVVLKRWSDYQHARTRCNL